LSSFSKYDYPLTLGWLDILLIFDLSLKQSICTTLYPFSFLFHFMWKEGFKPEVFFFNWGEIYTDYSVCFSSRF